MRVLGIDPGLTRCGFGVVDGTVGRALTMIDVGVFRTPPDLDTSRRLLLLEQGIEASILEHHPDVVAVERVFSQHNVRTVMGTAQASGGRADKPQVTQMVTRLLRLTDAPKPADAADALALAICQIWRGGAHNRLQAAIHSAQLRTAGTTRAAR